MGSAEAKEDPGVKKDKLCEKKNGQHTMVNPHCGDLLVREGATLAASAPELNRPEERHSLMKKEAESHQEKTRPKNRERGRERHKNRWGPQRKREKEKS